MSEETMSFTTITVVQLVRSGRKIPQWQYRYREIFEGDVFYQEQTWSQETEIVLRTASTAENNMGSIIKVMRRFHRATVYPSNNYTVTVATFEPKEKGDKHTMRLVSARRALMFA
ncbi:hypothetical protein PQX77_009130 [Marasmius sp. AFHP31]|nr:hypothetical protein PQX77_009130 [Marasmius sp. AFHP31]